MSSQTLATMIRQVSLLDVEQYVAVVPKCEQETKIKANKATLRSSSFTSKDAIKSIV